MKPYILNDEQRKLVEDNMGLVPYTLRKCYGSEIAYDEDINSIAMISLCRAACTFDPSRGVCFSTYAVNCIVREMKCYWKNEYEKHRVGEDAISSLNIPIDTDEDCSIELIDTIADPHTNVEKEAINHILYETIKPYIPTLDTLTRLSMTPATLAKKVGIVKQRACQWKDGEIRLARNVLEGRLKDNVVPSYLQARREKLSKVTV